MELSQSRTRAVLNYSLSLNTLADKNAWMIKTTVPMAYPLQNWFIQIKKKIKHYLEELNLQLEQKLKKLFLIY